VGNLAIVQSVRGAVEALLTPKQVRLIVCCFRFAFCPLSWCCGSFADCGHACLIACESLQRCACSSSSVVAWAYPLSDTLLLSTSFPRYVQVALVFQNLEEIAAFHSQTLLPLLLDSSKGDAVGDVSSVL
jgi:hypothetical protein